MKKRHHYVPRLILRRFDKKLSTFNLKTGEIKINGSELMKIFVTDYLYTPEIENLLNEKIESEFAAILKDKILALETEVCLKRSELNVVKKFLLIAMLRTLDGEYYMSLRKDTESETLKEIIEFEEKNVEGLSDYDYWMRTIKCILESKDLLAVSNHPEATNEAVRWAFTYNSGYIAFWDSSNSKEDFVVIDNGMTSEHEVTRFIKEIGNDAIKRGYLIEQTLFSPELNKESKINNFINYHNLMLSLDSFTENFYLFSISKNRMIALINPFFSLYDKNSFEGTSTLPIPDIWTTRIKDRSLFLKNKTKYVNGTAETLKGKTDENDLYIYPIRQMNLEDVIYVNCLSFDRISNVLGFADSSGIRRSLAVYSTIEGHNNYQKLIDYFKDIGNPIVINKFARKISEHIAPGVVKFSEIERKYIANFLKLRKVSNSSKWKQGLKPQ